MCPPTILTVATLLLFASVPVAAALPPPNTLPCVPVEELDPTVVFPSTVIVVFPETIALLPLPPAYILPPIVESVIYTSVFPLTTP